MVRLPPQVRGHDTMRRSPALKLPRVGEDISPGVTERPPPPRLQPPGPLTCQVQLPGKDGPVPATVENLSAGGMALLVDQPVPPGTRLHVQLTNPAHTFWLSMTVTILRSQPGQTGSWFLAGEVDRTLMPDGLKPFVLYPPLTRRRAARTGR